MFSRISTFVFGAFLAGSAACSSAPTDATSETDDAVKYIAGFPAGSYFQVDSAYPAAGEISLVMFASPTTFWGEQCPDAACNAVAINGTYKRSKTRLYLYDASHRPLGTWSYTLRGGTLTLHDLGTGDRYALDPMSEALCDSSGGAWTDDSLTTQGFNCTCLDGQDWGPSGCPAAPCSAPMTTCGGSCVDLTTDPTNCGACGATCTKAQHCMSGVCQ